METINTIGSVNNLINVNLRNNEIGDNSVHNKLLHAYNKSAEGIFIVTAESLADREKVQFIFNKFYKFIMMNSDGVKSINQPESRVMVHELDGRYYVSSKVSLDRCKKYLNSIRTK